MGKPVDVGVGTRLGPRTIEVSRLKISLYLVMALVFVVGGAAMTQDPSASVMGWLCVLFFGLGGAVFIMLLIRPQALDLDADGFTLRGGFVRSPKKVLWRDVEGFFVYRLPKGGKMIGYNLRPAARKDTVLQKLSSSLGADGGHPQGMARIAREDGRGAERLSAVGAGPFERPGGMTTAGLPANPVAPAVAGETDPS